MITIKTLIELYDECRIKNVMAALNFKPEKLVFVGFKETMKRESIKAVERLLRSRSTGVSIEYEVVGRYDYAEMVRKFNAITDANEDCAVDLTGGRELLLTAIGEVATKKRIPLFQFDVKTGRLITVKNCEGLSVRQKPVMSIDECIALNGGKVVQDTEGFPRELTESFRNDIEVMWAICRKNPALWNKNSNILSELDKGEDNPDSLYVKGTKKRQPMRRIMNELEGYGLIRKLRIDKGTTEFAYKNHQVRRCLLKAGNILELYIYMLATEIREEKPGFYDDIKTGIVVDWDGEVRDDADTLNEIDIMMMRDVVPVFVSCKNGELYKEALYELETVAKRLGGSFSKKIIATTYISKNEDRCKYIIKRARDMKIEIIYNIHKMTRDEIKNALRTRAV